MQLMSGMRSGAALLLALGLGVPALAQAQAPDFERELWVTSGFRSHHTKNRARYNERNDGLGLEWRWAPDWQVNAGHYRNSVRRGSTYAQLGWTPLETTLPLELRLRAGAAVGVINGYTKVRRGGYFGTLVPVVSLESRHVGLNLVYIPSVGKRVNGAYALQLKVRVG
ncbi:MAG: hypothetical protein AB1430_09980 [Pseudomonadota bacterium]